MAQRLAVNDIDPTAYQAVLAMERYVRNSGLDKPLYELIKIRASQLNGCAYCLDMHHRDARAGGEDQRRLDVLSAWREAPGIYTERERAALALTEAVTLIGEDGVPDEVWADATRPLTTRAWSNCSWPSRRSMSGTGLQSAPTNSYRTCRRPDRWAQHKRPQQVQGHRDERQRPHR